MKETIDPRVLAQLGLTGDESGEMLVCCPFHDDSTPSASWNADKGLLNCHACAEGWHHSQIAAIIDTAQGGPAPEEEPDDTIEVGEVKTVAKNHRAFLKARGFKTLTDIGCRLGSSGRYLYFGQHDNEEWQVGRNMGEVDEYHPRYNNAAGKKNLFWLSRPEEAARGVWLTEGVLDALALRQVMPNAQIASTLSATGLGKPGAYDLRGLTVFICYDLDHVGYEGSKKAAELLVEYGASPIIVEMPKKMGKDLGEALEKYPEKIQAWAEDIQAEYATDDQQWIESAFVKGETPPLFVLGTGIPSWDALLGGGFSEGVHAIGAETGAGKSSWAIRFAVESVLAGHRVLYVTNEISKRQVWARVASCKDKQEWNVLEKRPTDVSKATVAWLRKVSKGLRVVAGWDVAQITYAASNYDAIVVDYLQRMPGIHAGVEAERHNVEHNITQLSNLGRDLGKVVVTIQRFKNGLGQASIDSFYGSSAIKYVVQSGTVFKAVPGQQRISIVMGKNTRGSTGSLICGTDLGHQRFIDEGEMVVGGTGMVNTGGA